MEIVASAPAQMGLAEIGPWSARMERIGFDSIHISETIHDPFGIAAMALAHTTTLTVRTSMVLAFPRSPMVTAYAAWDLAKYSGGRFHLGIASQVRGNIVGRFSAQWSEPVARLRDYIGSLRAIFGCFQNGGPLDYSGPVYRFTRLQPYFNPGPLEHPEPPIWTGGVNPRMCALAGELADGFVCHPTNSHPRTLRTATVPAIAEGARLAGRDRLPAIIVNAQPVMAEDPGALDLLRDKRRTELAFLYSTPAYRQQLDTFGLTGLGEVLSSMARRSAWDDLAHHLTDEVIDMIVPQGTYEQMPDILDQWYSGLCSGLTLPVPAGDVGPDHDTHLGTVVQRCKAIPAAAC